MGCNCKKQEPTPLPTIPVIPMVPENRKNYPDTPEGQLAYELDKNNKEKYNETFLSNVNPDEFKTTNDNG